jgi:hypothetical protein
MYTWHWEEEFWKDVIISFNHHPVAHKYFDPILALKEMMVNQTDFVRRKQDLIRQRVFELQYGIDGRHEVEKITDGHHVDKFDHLMKSTWPRDSSGRPMRDAFDICIDHALGWHSGSEPDVRKGTVPECWDGHLNKTLNKCVLSDPVEQR